MLHGHLDGHHTERNADTPRFPMMATIDITKLSAKVLDYTDAEDGTDLKVMFFL